ncbi:hypothetical protein [Rubrimonas cliftonensis]|uniref:Uncharacterized protein n=1 Tax=Rubrimonas cliftonensis TaxID=89524 RepID=A0A1H4EQY3_9RHOB|nr:hypothetical protein [Rubrimonas cliftonensis]SEA87259.1 hypothetical protein SAMN05444370_11540 [Rubrimonas cliftonensis]
MTARSPRESRKALDFPDNPFDAAGYVGDLVCLVLGAEEPPPAAQTPYRHWRADAVRRITGCLDACVFASGVDFAAIAAAVAAHAQAHYGKDGWDFIVECWTLDEIIAELREEGVASRSAAIADFARIAALLDERRAEVRAEAW